MKFRVLSLILGLFIFISCTSPEQEIINAHEQFVRALKEKECKHIKKAFPESNKELFKHFKKLCPYMKGRIQIFYPDKPKLKDINIHNDSASASINGKYRINFVRSEGQWRISKAPLWQVQLTGVVFLYAMDMSYYELAKIYSVKDSKEMIKLMEQFEKLSGKKLQKPAKTDLNMVITDVRIYDDFAYTST